MSARATVWIGRSRCARPASSRITFSLARHAQRGDATLFHGCGIAVFLTASTGHRGMRQAGSIAFFTTALPTRSPPPHLSQGNSTNYEQILARLQTGSDETVRRLLEAFMPQVGLIARNSRQFGSLLSSLFTMRVTAPDVAAAQAHAAAVAAAHPTASRSVLLPSQPGSALMGVMRSSAGGVVAGGGDSRGITHPATLAVFMRLLSELVSASPILTHDALKAVTRVVTALAREAGSLSVAGGSTTLFAGAVAGQQSTALQQSRGPLPAGSAALMAVCVDGLASVVHRVPTSMATLAGLVKDSWPHKRLPRIALQAYATVVVVLAGRCAGLADRLFAMLVERLVELDADIDIDKLAPVGEEEEDGGGGARPGSTHVGDGGPGAPAGGDEEAEASMDASLKLDGLFGLAVQYLHATVCGCEGIPTPPWWDGSTGGTADGAGATARSGEGSQRDGGGGDGDGEGEGDGTQRMCYRMHALLTTAMGVAGRDDEGDSGAAAGGAPLPAPSPAADHAFAVALTVFERSVLTAHKSKFTQFLLFLLCACDVSFAERFVARLLHNIRNPDKSPLMRCTCAAYAGSFLARAAYVDDTTLRSALLYLMEYAHAYVALYDAHARRGEQVARLLELQKQLPAQQLVLTDEETGTIIVIPPGCDPASCMPPLVPLPPRSVWYAVVQAALYITCFHAASLHGKAGGLEYLRSLDWQPLMTCALDPLAHVLESVASEWVRIATMLGLIQPRALAGSAAFHRLVPSASGGSVSNPTPPPAAAAGSGGDKAGTVSTTTGTQAGDAAALPARRSSMSSGSAGVAMSGVGAGRMGGGGADHGHADTGGGVSTPVRSISVMPGPPASGGGDSHGSGAADHFAYHHAASHAPLATSPLPHGQLPHPHHQPQHPRQGAMVLTSRSDPDALASLSHQLADVAASVSGGTNGAAAESTRLAGSVPDGGGAFGSGTRDAAGHATRADMGGDGAGVGGGSGGGVFAQLDSFFPFDPFLLQHSSALVAPLYRTWGDVALSAEAAGMGEGNWLTDTDGHITGDDAMAGAGGRTSSAAHTDDDVSAGSGRGRRTISAASEATTASSTTSSSSSSDSDSAASAEASAGRRTHLAAAASSGDGEDSDATSLSARLRGGGGGGGSGAIATRAMARIHASLGLAPDAMEDNVADGWPAAAAVRPRKRRTGQAATRRPPSGRTRADSLAALGLVPAADGAGAGGGSSGLQSRMQRAAFAAEEEGIQRVKRELDASAGAASRRGGGGADSAVTVMTPVTSLGSKMRGLSFDESGYYRALLATQGDGGGDGAEAPPTLPLKRSRPSDDGPPASDATDGRAAPSAPQRARLLAPPTMVWSGGALPPRAPGLHTGSSDDVLLTSPSLDGSTSTGPASIAPPSRSAADRLSAAATVVDAGTSSGGGGGGGRSGAGSAHSSGVAGMKQEGGGGGGGGGGGDADTVDDASTTGPPPWDLFADLMNREADALAGAHSSSAAPTATSGSSSEDEDEQGGM